MITHFANGTPDWEQSYIQMHAYLTCVLKVIGVDVVCMKDAPAKLTDGEGFEVVDLPDGKAAIGYRNNLTRNGD